MKPRVGFDLDETLGVPIIAGDVITGFQVRQGCFSLLQRIQPHYVLCLWSVSSRRYLDKVLSFGLGSLFEETYSWDELPTSWKDIRRLRLDYLVDDSPYHREAAARHGLADRYIIVPAYGSPEDQREPLLWAQRVENVLLSGVVP
jgi:hypothetical protein